MKNILNLSANKAKEFLIKEESYINFDLPIYFKFQTLLFKINDKLDNKILVEFYANKTKPRDFEDVNYHLFSNKDGKYAWRPFQIIHPALYVSLVHAITQKDNWTVIKKRFKEFSANDKIECHSLPMVSETKNKTDKEIQILYSWWQQIEQQSLTLSIKYKYLLHTDISDCYSSIYTHSLSWAIHEKEFAKKKENRNKKSLVGVIIDQHLQDMNFGQTNGIPQGSVLMDFIAEIVLGYIDYLLSSKLQETKITDYKILRYRDDYRIFTNNPFEAEHITRILSEILTELGLKLNAEKTLVTDNVIASALKKDKLYWIQFKRKTENKQKWLLQLYMLAEKFPNSGTLDTQMKEFLTVLKNSKRKDRNVESLISIVTEIVFRNPRVTPRAIAILSLLINQLANDKDKKSIFEDIQNKFKLIPNSSLLEIWLQRIYLKYDCSITYKEKLSQKVVDNTTQIWNSDWLKDTMKNLITTNSIVYQKQLSTLKKVISKKEIIKMGNKSNTYY